MFIFKWSFIGATGDRIHCEKTFNTAREALDFRRATIDRLSDNNGFHCGHVTEVQNG